MLAGAHNAKVAEKPKFSKNLKFYKKKEKNKNQSYDKVAL